MNVQPYFYFSWLGAWSDNIVWIWAENEVFLGYCLVLQKESEVLCMLKIGFCACSFEKRVEVFKKCVLTIVKNWNGNCIQNQCTSTCGSKHRQCEHVVGVPWRAPYEWMEVWLICSAPESHRLARLQSPARLFISLCHSQHSLTHTHADTFGMLLATRTISLDSLNAINLKQTNIQRHHIITAKQIMLTDISKSIYEDKHAILYSQSPLWLQNHTIQGPLACSHKVNTE